MKNRYQQLMPYEKPPLYIDKYNLYRKQTNMLGIQPATGLIRLNIIDQVTKKEIPNSTITFYVTDGPDRDIPIIHIVTILNPIRIELPMANDLGTKIVGPEYAFSTYNLSVNVFGYFTNYIYNVRLFPDVTTDFTVEMIPVTQPQMTPIIEERTEIPPHPRDEPVNSQNFYKVEKYFHSSPW